MKKFKGNYEKIFEQTLYRYQQGGFLRGDYVRIKKDALNHPVVKQMSDQLKSILENAMKSDTYYRVSYIKSGHSEAFNGPVDAANIPSEMLWADVIHEYAPGMWKDPLTLPLEVLEKVEVEGAEGYAQYPDSLKRKNDFSNDESKEVDQTKGKDENRKLHNKNKKLEYTSEPRSGIKDTKPLKDSIQIPRRENDLIFENYKNSLVEIHDLESVKAPEQELSKITDVLDDIPTLASRISEIKQQNRDSALAVLRWLYSNHPDKYREVNDYQLQQRLSTPEVADVTL